MRIKNIVFDMGEVLMRYEPEKISRSFFENEQEANQVCKELFGGPEWLLLDADAITEEQLLAGVLSRLPEHLHARTKDLFAGWYKQVPPIEATNQLAFQLKEAGYRLFILSNAAKSFYSYCPQQMPAYSCFDGVVVSADEKAVKPDETLYRILFKRYNIIAQESFFIDDREENIAAAEKLGMQGFRFTGKIDEIIDALHHAGVHIKR